MHTVPKPVGKGHIVDGIFDSINYHESVKEVEQFSNLQSNFPAQFESVFPDRYAPKTVVIVPSLTLDQEILAKIQGHVYYEERMLCMLMLLRMPRTHVIYVTSVPIDPVIVDYYLNLLPGITGYHARQRLTLLSCYDASKKSLTEKILERPRLINRIRSSIPLGHLAHLSCFNVTNHERTLAVQLSIPIFGCDPALYYLGTKSVGRKLFAKCDIPVPDGYEDITSEKEISHALVELKSKNPKLKRAVIKINDGFSGEGNATFSYKGAPEKGGLFKWVCDALPQRLKIVATGVNYQQFMEKFSGMHGIVEEYIEGNNKRSPSVQCRINPLGKSEVISTHDQVLGGESGQVFIGATFPADEEYSREIGSLGKIVSNELKNYGVLGRFSVDFISVKENNTWKHYAIEINLRKGGTTHPYLMLQFLTDGEYDAEQGKYSMPNGQSRCYFATDNFQEHCCKGLTPHDLIDIAINNNLHYDATLQEGVMFHLIGTLSQYGKLGVLSVGKDFQSVENIYQRTVSMLKKATDYPNNRLFI